nr:MAG TPA: hypothetical protein [Caudoviricetes sp.]
MLQLFCHPLPFLLCLILKPCRTARGLFLRLWFARIKASLARIALKHLYCCRLWFSSSLCHCPHLPVNGIIKRPPKRPSDLCVYS